MIYCEPSFSVFSTTSVNTFLLEGEMPGQSPWRLPRLLLLPGRGMDIFTDNQHGIHHKCANYELKQRVTRESACIRIYDKRVNQISMVTKELKDFLWCEIL
jgi:hypothetical protein